MDTSYTTTDMHTGGMPVRIIERGYPNIPRDTILEKMKWLKQKLDDRRKLLLWEPRGHHDMFGVILVSPDITTTDIGAIFVQNEGYMTMCGHAVISLGRYLVDKGFVKNKTIPETVVNIQCPCGMVEARVQYDGCKTGAVRFFSVSAFLYAKGYGAIKVDIAYGGAFYALVSASEYNLGVTSSIHIIREAAGVTTDILRKQLKLVHPESSDLAYLFGTIVTDGNDEYNEEITANCCVFADRQVDRSPCGSGVTARIAQQFGRKLIELGQSRTFEGPTGAMFKATPVRKVICGDFNAVVVEVSGHGYYTGTSTFTSEADDDIGRGFLLH